MEEDMVTIRFWFISDDKPFAVDFIPLEDQRFLEGFDVGTKENVRDWLVDVLEDYAEEGWRYFAIDDADGAQAILDLPKVCAVSVEYPEDA